MLETIHDLNDPAFSALFTSFTESAWRLETLPVYDVGYEREAFAAFLDGDKGPIYDAPNSWVDEVIEPAAAADRYIGRVHIVERTVDDMGNLALNDYLRFEFECYKRSRAAGEDIRIAWTEPGTWPGRVGKKGEDFWLFDAHTDHARVAQMVYTPEGQFEKAVLTDGVRAVREAHQVARAAQRASKPFYP